MKKLLIILAFIPLFGFGQIQSLDNVWNGTINVVGSDTLLYDSISASNTTWKLIGYSGDITLGYLKLNKSGYLVILNDTFTIQQAGGIGLRNTNDADTLFFQNQNSRLTRIGYSATPAPDINDYWQALTITGTMLDVCPACTYTSIDAASTAANDNDTVIVYEGEYTENGSQGGVFVNNDGLKFISLAKVDIKAGGTYATYISSADNVEFSGFNIINESGNYCARAVGTTTELTYSNCWFEAGTHVMLNAEDNSSYTTYWNECYINDRIDCRTTFEVNNSRIEGEERIFLTGADQATATINYSDFGPTTTGAIRLVVSTPLNVNYSTFRGIVITDSGVESGDRFFRGDTIKKIDDNVPMVFDNGGGDIFIDSCYFLDEHKSGVNPIIKITDHNITVDSSTFDSITWGGED